MTVVDKIRQVRYPFEKYGYASSNWIVDPDHWAVIAVIDRQGLWRVAYAETPGLTEDEYRARTPMKYAKLLPGFTKMEDVEMTNWTPYHIHNRLAPRMAIGRIALAGDAGHLNNPM